MMERQLIVITPPQFVDNEAEIIEQMFYLGLDRLHIRKPNATDSDVESLLQLLPESCLQRCSIHYHHHLGVKYHLGGLHLSGNMHNVRANDTHLMSSSCHTLQELTFPRAQQCDYNFLSPIFDSISKQGYYSNFTPQTLLQASHDGVINEHVIALGGVSLDTVPQLQAYHFGGAAILGEVWNKARCCTAQEFTTYFNTLLASIKI